MRVFYHRIYDRGSHILKIFSNFKWRGTQVASHLPSANAHLVRGSLPLKPFSLAWIKASQSPRLRLRSIVGYTSIKSYTENYLVFVG